VRSVGDEGADGTAAGGTGALPWSEPGCRNRQPLERAVV